MSRRGSSSKNLNVPKADNDPKKSPSEVEGGRRKDPQQKGSDKNDSNRRALLPAHHQNPHQTSSSGPSSSSHQKSSVGSPNQPVARDTTTTTRATRARNQTESSSGPSVSKIRHSRPGSYVRDEEKHNDPGASSTAKLSRNQETCNYILGSTTGTNVEIQNNIRATTDHQIKQLDLKKKPAEANSVQASIRTTTGQTDDYLKQGSVQKETPGHGRIHRGNYIPEKKKMDLPVKEKPNDKNKSKK